MATVISKEFRFEASHVLPEHPGKCSRLHGHSWVLEVAVSGPVNKHTGFVMDYGDLKALVQREIVDQVDHQHLGFGNLVCPSSSALARGMVPYPTPPILPTNFYPSSENLAELFGKILVDRLKALPRNEGQAEIKLEWVSLKETCTSEALWVPE